MSDTMCAKTTETSRCQRCGSKFDWLSDGTKVHVGKQYFESDSLLCLERQLNAANQRIKWLEEALDLVIPNCSWVHHPKKHQHKCGEPCPVVALIEKAKEAKP